MDIKSKQTKYQSRSLFIFISSIMLSLFAFLPLSNTLWAEKLNLGGLIQIGSWETSTPPGQAGTTLSAEKTAVGFAEEIDGEIIYGVRGEICVSNGGERATEGLTIIDTVQVKAGAGGFEDYYSETVDVSIKPILEPGEGYCYPYEISFDPPVAEKTGFRNTAKVTIANHSGWLPGGNHCEGPDPCYFGPTPKIGFELPEPPTLATELFATQSTFTILETISGETFYSTQGEICITNTGIHYTKGLLIQTSVQNQVKDAFEDKATSEFSGIELAPEEKYCYSYDLSFPDPEETLKEPQLLTIVTINNYVGWLGHSENCPEELCAFGKKLISALEFPIPPPPTPTETPVPVEDTTTLSVEKSAMGFVNITVEGEPQYGVQGEVCVKNEGNIPTENLALFDTVQLKTSSEEGAPFESYFEIQLDTKDKPILDAGELFCYPYAFTFILPESEVIQFRNTVNAAITNYVEWLPGEENCLGPESCLYGPIASAEFELPDAPDAEEPDGEEPDGEEPDGEEPDGEEPDGEEPDGEEPDGEEPDGEEPDGEEPDGEEPDGEEPDGEEPDTEEPDTEEPDTEEPDTEE